MGGAPSAPQEEYYCPDLAGVWRPTRCSEWTNDNIGSHKMRAKMPNSKMTYRTDGKGEGWVGDLYVFVAARPDGPGRYVAKGVVKLLWSASDGQLILSDGNNALQVRYPSNGIVEYWRREGSGTIEGHQDDEATRQAAEAADARRREREAAMARAQQEVEAAEARRREQEAAEARARQEAEAAEARRREQEAAEARARQEAEAAEARRREQEAAAARARQEAEAAEARLQAAAAAARIQLFVQPLTGGTITLDIESCASIEDVRMMIQDKEGIPSDLQRLIFQGKQLNPEKTLADYSVRNECTLHMVLSRDPRYMASPSPRVAEALRSLSAGASELDLHNNAGTGDSGAELLAGALCENRTLVRASFCGNGIGDDGAAALADTLCVNQALRELHLGCNKVKDEGAMRLAEMLHVNTTLSALHLDQNEIGNEGAQSLILALRCNTTLKSLSIGANLMDPTVAKTLRELVEQNSMDPAAALSRSQAALRELAKTPSSSPRAADAAVGGEGGRQAPVAEESIKMLPNTNWEAIKPPCSCADFLRNSETVRTACPRIDVIVDDCLAKAEELRFEDDLPAKLDDNQVVALAAYSHDSGGAQEGNFYFELNKALRKRGQDERKALIDGWGVYMHYIMGAMAKLPKVEGVCYRGYPDKAVVLAQYKPGRPIQWGAFASTTTDFDSTKGFTDPAAGVIFKITVTDGRDINAFSFFPYEAEVLLSPQHRFHVSSAPYDRDGYTVIDLVQDAGCTFVS